MSIEVNSEHRFAQYIRNQQAAGDRRELSVINYGPTHPSTHGIFQNILLMEGERILDVDQTVGYIHRAFEK